MSANIDGKLWNAARRGDEALVTQLIDQATVDWRGYSNDWGASDWTALHLAAHNGHTPVVTLLLDAGWSLEARSGGFTPLAYAALRGHLETVNCLLLRGADINTQDNYKDTPLHLASRNGHSEMVKTLLHHGANQEIRNYAGKTAEDDALNDKTRAVFKEINGDNNAKNK